MSRQKTLEKIEQTGIIAVIRLNAEAKLPNIVDALSKGGIRALEITLTTPNAVDIIKNISKTLDSDFLIGAGTVLDAQAAEAVIRAGAQFVVSPVLNLDVIRLAHRYDKIVFPGAFTPTEILKAWENGADVVKVFPATALGPEFFKDIHGPLPQVKLTPTGGVSLENAGDFIRAGACCLGVGTALLNKKMIADSDWSALSDLAARFISEVKKARS